MFDLEVDQIGRAVADLVERGEFRRVRLDVGEGAVRIDRRHEERLLIRLEPEREGEVRRVGRLEGIDPFVDGLGRLVARGLRVFLRGVGRVPQFVHFGGGIELPRALPHPFHGSVGHDVQLQVRLGRPLGQQEGVHVAARGDQIEVGRRAGFRRLHIGEILGAGHDPELLVAAHEIENLFRLGQDDHRREAELRVDADD